MTAPVFQTAGTYGQTSGGSPATSITLNAPASIAAGDLLELHLTMDNASATINTPPAGWTQAGSSPVIINTGGNQQNAVWYKWATGSEPSTYVFGFSASTFAEGGILRISGGVGSGNPYDFTTSATNPSSGSTSTPSVSGTTLGANRLIVHAYTKVNSGAFTPNASPAYTTRLGGGFNTLGASTATQAATGSTGGVVATKATTDQSTAWLGAIAPASAGAAGDGATQQHGVTAAAGAKAVTRAGAPTGHVSTTSTGFKTVTRAAAAIAHPSAQNVTKKISAAAAMSLAHPATAGAVRKLAMAIAASLARGVSAASAARRAAASAVALTHPSSGAATGRRAAGVGAASARAQSVSAGQSGAPTPYATAVLTPGAAVPAVLTPGGGGATLTPGAAVAATLTPGSL